MENGYKCLGIRQGDGVKDQGIKEKMMREYAKRVQKVQSPN